MKRCGCIYFGSQRAMKLALASLLWLIAGLAVVSSPTLAAKPETRPYLPIILSIELPGEKVIDFSLTDLENLGVSLFETTTPWTEGKTRFEGIYLKQLLTVVGAKGSQIKAVALNDYASELPFEGAETENALIAYKMNGKQLSVRENGPLWIIYPFDQYPSLKQETIYSRSVWQLRKLVILD